MKIMITGAMLAASLALAAPALAVSGQCSLTGYDEFECEVETDGGGLTFALPDGQTFAFVLVEENEGLGYLIAADARPGQLPGDLGTFAPLAEEPGCWQAERDEVKFCALVFE
ncbi:hypothetical protein JP75_23800 [Devosia riboflavina]|uniref:Uncharacterized protein n=1 Tax=Devosia riboflavina TaxID=46914 RepID=A0A087LWL5_9HYPH|nr:hypothetical protein [Devosia riboflavina]KFL29018.1 hypothetical protein JP75_23800 [Devosia riboflavina]